jgi:ubiquinone/menaquinone biosynthesis C-methylase UbiE
MINLKATSHTRRRYQRIAPFYDAMEYFTERQYSKWRRQIWSMVKGPKVLEVGVGTGMNMPHYPDRLVITGIDLSPAMLARAEKRASTLDLEIGLQVGDVQRLGFRDDVFDDAVATFVFCSVPDPLLGLKELTRVVKPGGRLLLLEHVRAEQATLAFLMDVVNPLIVRLIGANINRRTVDTIRRGGWRLTQVENIGMGSIFKLITAQPAQG